MHLTGMAGMDREQWRLDMERTTRRWRAEHDRKQREARSDLDRERREARWDLDRRKQDIERELEREAPVAPPSGFDGHPTPATQRLDDTVMRATCVLAVPLVALPLAAGHLSAFVVSGGWPSYEVSQAWGVLGRLPSHLGDPAAAWEPVNTGAPVPGPVAWWLTLVLLAAVCTLAGFMLVQASRSDRRQRAWASPWEQRRIEVRRGELHRVVVGTDGSRRLGVRDRHSLLVVGPAHAGKTSGLTIPALLEWQGPAVVASTKGHLVDQTIGWRSRQGDVHVFDPAAITPYHRSGWSPLAGCTSWEGAIRTAQDLTAAAAAAVGVTTDGEALAGAGKGVLWRSSVAMALAPYLFAAAATGRTIVDTLEWLAADEHYEVQEMLRVVDRAAAHAHAMAFLQPDPARSAYLRLMRQVLGVYEDPVAASSMDRHDIVPGELLDGGPHTLYLTAPEHDQARFRPLSATIVRQVVSAAYERSAAETGAIDPPLLVILDQVVGIAPVDDLAAVASTGPARGVQVVSVFQDLAQISGHYGPDTGLLVKNHRAKLVLPSPHDADPAGEGGGLLPPWLAGQLGEGEAALLYGSMRPVRVRLRRWFHDRDLRRRAATPQDALAPPDPVDTAPSPVAAEQVGAWRRRGPEVSSTPEDPTIPLDTTAPDYTDVFGSLHVDVDEDETPENVTPFPAGRSRFRRTRR
jgi:type IV secretion system protein VirD4